jgi:hypothetical protein
MKGQRDVQERERMGVGGEGEQREGKEKRDSKQER